MSRGNVLLVPGFMGNQLEVSLIGREYKAYWCNLVLMAQYGFEALTLPTFDRPPVRQFRADVRPGPLMEGPYRDVTQYLQLREWEVVQVPLDWRKPIEDSAAVVHERIIRDPEEWPWHIVCHSRGGLVVRVALGMLTADQRPAAVGRVIGVGVPHVGSLQAVATLGDASDFLRKIKRAVQLARPFTNPFAVGNRVEECLRSWPALYQLLPDPVRSPLPQEYAQAIYLASSYADDGMDVYPVHLAAAQAAWNRIPAVFPSVEWVDVVGRGVETVAGLDVPLRLTTRRGYFLADGDGTVVPASAGWPGRVRITLPCQHDALLRDGRLLPLIHAALQELPGEDVKITGPVAF